MTAVLEVKGLKVAYGKILAVKKISFSVDEGQVVPAHHLRAHPTIRR